ncbi:MAG: MBL fold metallo-hydrolase [Bacteroidetes bacterium]|nr:MBL fold metallo-hydrolase [Bacteroidota bacterium]
MIIPFALAILIFAVYQFLQHPKFGKVPMGEQLETIKQSPNFKNGKFENIHHTPEILEGVSYFKVFKEFFFNKSKANKPANILPTQKTDLLNLSSSENILVWFGHSSYFMQIDGKKILVDPVLSGSASPVQFTTKSFKGSDVYTTEDIPEIDYLFISHDHWDHLDYETITALKPKIKKVITGLGVGAHLQYWGFNQEIITEKDWNEEIVLHPGFTVHTASARHFSGRLFKRGQSIWSSFVLKTPSMKIYLGGDSGYDTHFSEIGKKHGPFDLAILECGQYNLYWKYIHMLPHEVIQAAEDLHTKKILPVHWAKFSLSLHAWDDPIKEVIKANKNNIPLLHPMIGEKVDLKSDFVGEVWWEKVK